MIKGSRAKVEQPTKFTLNINVKVAKALGFTVPRRSSQPPPTARCR
jgi:hypothetical protein